MLGLDIDGVRAAVDAARARRGRVQMANFNAPGQIVVSGDHAAVHAAPARSRSTRGAKRVIPLNVSGAWHSELMRPAQRALRALRRTRRSSSMPRFTVDLQRRRPAVSRRRPDPPQPDRVVDRRGSVARYRAALLAEGIDAIVEFGASPVLVPLDAAPAEARRACSTSATSPASSGCATRSATRARHDVRRQGRTRYRCEPRDRHGRSRSSLRVTAPTSRSSRARRPTWRKPPPSAGPRAPRHACCRSSPSAADQQAVDAAVGRTIAELGRIDCRGRERRASRRRARRARDTRGTSTRCWITNLKSAFYLVTAVARPMMKQRSGSIVLVSSIVGLSGNAGQAPTPRPKPACSAWRSR